MQPFRAFLKADRWPDLQQHVSDQRKGVPPPPLAKACPQPGALIDLPRPDTLAVGQMPLAEAIARRKSQRRYTKEPLTLEELSFLLWAAQGVRETGRHGKTPYLLRTVPSAGARHPLETYLLVNRVEGLEPGMYHYQSLKHQLCLLDTDERLVERTHEGCFGQYAKNSAVTFLWTAVPYRTEWRYTIVSPKLIALDAGHVCQNLYLACTAVGAGACAIAAYDQQMLDAVLDLDGDDEFVIYVATVGKVRE
ncbi:MAG: SagB/ThcOx family dehydrogenase [Anaerolineae bacterium]|jgi:SagB-type dehydrogenase family enzyme